MESLDEKIVGKKVVWMGWAEACEDEDPEWLILFEDRTVIKGFFKEVEDSESYLTNLLSEEIKRSKSILELEKLLNAPEDSHGDEPAVSQDETSSPSEEGT